MADSAYLRDGNAIYERSFAIIRSEADLSRFSPDEAGIVVRMIHACGLVEAARHIMFGEGLVAAARDALAANSRGVPFLVVRGRMGGSAMAAAAVNALARPGL